MLNQFSAQRFMEILIQMNNTQSNGNDALTDLQALLQAEQSKANDPSNKSISQMFGEHERFLSSEDTESVSSFYSRVFRDKADKFWCILHFNGDLTGSIGKTLVNDLEADEFMGNTNMSKEFRSNGFDSEKAYIISYELGKTRIKGITECPVIV